MRRIIFGLAWGVPICTVVAALALAFCYREPSYEGKPFSYWLAQIPCTVARPNGSVSIMYPHVYSTKAELEANRKQNMEGSQKGLKAVSQIGSQCLPLLLRRLRSRNSAWETGAFQLAMKSHIVPGSWLREFDTRLRSTDLKRGQALTAIIKLDYSAKPLFASLGVLARDSDPGVKAAAKYALRELNPAELERLEALQRASASKAK